MGDPSGIQLDNGKLLTVFYDTANHHVAGVISDGAFFVSDSSNDCSCGCHVTGIKNIIFRIINFFQKLFGLNKICACGAAH